MKLRLSKMVTGLLGVAALVAVASSPTQAAFVVGGEQGWQMSFDGMVNVFASYTMVEGADGHGNILSSDQSFRVRTGLLPNIIGFNVKSPTINGIDYAARLALDPQNQNSGVRNGFGPSSAGGGSLDLREIFMTADGCFGQVLAGRAINLYQAKNILTDMTLSGVGVYGAFGSGDLTGGGTALGRIGYGYLYANFGAQFRYTTPDLNGLKVALEIGDPSRIGATAAKINQPRFETEISYAKTFNGGKMQAWLSGLYQEAKDVAADRKVASIGGAGGAQIVYGPVDVVVSGFGGQGLGILLLQDLADAVDANGEERISYGILAQTQYTFGKFRLGAQYGINYLERTDFDGVGAALIKSQQAVTGGLYYSLNKYTQLVGEYTWARDTFYDSYRVNKNIISVGTVFVW